MTVERSNQTKKQGLQKDCKSSNDNNNVEPPRHRQQQKDEEEKKLFSCWGGKKTVGEKLVARQKFEFGGRMGRLLGCSQSAHDHGRNLVL